MGIERIVGTLGSREELNTEALEQGAGSERVAGEPFANTVEIEVARRFIQRDVEAQDLGEDMVEPQLRRCTTEQVIVAGKGAPRLARVGVGRAVARRYAELSEVDALAIEHAEQIMVGRKQQAGRIAPRRIGSEPARIGMAVRRDDRQPGDPGI